MDDYWEPAKKQLLADAKGFMESLVKFDKDNIPDRIIKKVNKKDNITCWWWWTTWYLFLLRSCHNVGLGHILDLKRKRYYTTSGYGREADRGYERSGQ